MSKAHNSRRREQKAQWAENRRQVEEQRKALMAAEENRRKMVAEMDQEGRRAVLSQLYQANLAMLREQRSAQSTAAGENAP